MPEDRPFTILYEAFCTLSVLFIGSVEITKIRPDPTDWKQTPQTPHKTIDLATLFLRSERGSKICVLQGKWDEKTHQSFEPLRVLLGAPSLLRVFT